MPSITIKELHRATGAAIRRAGRSRVPVVVTDHGEPVAVIANPVLLKGVRRKRTLLPEFKALMEKKPKGDVLEDLTVIRGDR